MAGGKGDSKKRGPVRLLRGDLAPYRARFIAGEDLDELAPVLLAEFPKIETAAHAKAILQRRAHLESWPYQREEHRERIAKSIEARSVADHVEGHLQTLAAEADMLRRLGLEALTRLEPESVPEALKMYELGVDKGLRARNLPQKINVHGVVGRILPQAETAAVLGMQELSPGHYEATADSLTAYFPPPVERPASPSGS